jgi:hypothetical protein
MGTLPATGGEDLGRMIDNLAPDLADGFAALDELAGLKEQMAIDAKQYELIASLQKEGVVDRAVARALHARRFLPEGRDFRALVFRWVDEQGVARGGGIRMPRLVTSPDQAPHHDVLIFAYDDVGTPEAINGFRPRSLCRLGSHRHTGLRAVAWLAAAAFAGLYPSCARTSRSVIPALIY